jgi:exosortase B
MSAAAIEPAPSNPFRVGAAWPLLIGILGLALPTFFSLATQSWSDEAGAHGPIILATGGWLIWRQFPEMRREARPGNLALTLAILLPSLALYVLGRAYDFITFEAAGLYGAGLATMHRLVGLRVMLKNWFPLLYLAFAIPPPNFLLDAITAPLKAFVSMAATNLLSFVGFPIARQGVVMYIAQYELLVEDACSGMNSLVGLTAISLFYIYIMRGSSWRYAMLLTAFVIPLAIVANILRIIVLVLVTYFFGDAAAQGFIHETAGILLFVIALLLVMGADSILAMILKPGRRAGSAANPA